jgi:hypothetical protein
MRSRFQLVPVVPENRLVSLPTGNLTVAERLEAREARTMRSLKCNLFHTRLVYPAISPTD